MASLSARGAAAVQLGLVMPQWRRNLSSPVISVASVLGAASGGTAAAFGTAGPSEGWVHAAQKWTVAINGRPLRLMVSSCKDLPLVLPTRAAALVVAADRDLAMKRIIAQKQTDGRDRAFRGPSCSPLWGLVLQAVALDPVQDPKGAVLRREAVEEELCRLLTTDTVLFPPSCHVAARVLMKASRHALSRLYLHSGFASKTSSHPPAPLHQVPHGLESPVVPATATLALGALLKKMSNWELSCFVAAARTLKSAVLPMLLLLPHQQQPKDTGDDRTVSLVNDSHATSVCRESSIGASLVVLQDKVFLDELAGLLPLNSCTNGRGPTSSVEKIFWLSNLEEAIQRRRFGNIPTVHEVGDCSRIAQLHDCVAFYGALQEGCA